MICMYVDYKGIREVNINTVKEAIDFLEYNDGTLYFMKDSADFNKMVEEAKRISRDFPRGEAWLELLMDPLEWTGKYKFISFNRVDREEFMISEAWGDSIYIPISMRTRIKYGVFIVVNLNLYKEITILKIGREYVDAYGKRVDVNIRIDEIERAIDFIESHGV